MENRHSGRLYTASATFMLTVILLSLTGALLPASNAVLGIDPATGAIWTTDPNGERVNGNLYTNPRNVYLAGGPHKKGAAGLPDGIYYFQVTDPAGKTLLSTDAISNRRFNVTHGYIYCIVPGTHKWNNDTTRGYGIVVQLWPFTYTPNKGGVYKVWVTREDHYYPLQLQGVFGFIPSLSKTDNFKVKLAEVPKYFELWVTDGISEPPDMEFYVSYTIDVDGTPVEPWATGRLIWDQTRGCFRYETSFALGSYIYWKFFARRVFNSFTWISIIYGPELIDKGGMVNKETLFMVKGHKYDYRDYLAGSLVGLEGWTIELYKDGDSIGVTQTDPDGYYELLGVGTGNYIVCEIVKADEGWANATPTCYKFTVDGNNGGDLTFNFYNYKLLRMSDTSDYRCELSSFDLVFTPSNENPDSYRLSSTNPGSFYYNVVKYGEAGTNVRIEVSLPPDHENDHENGVGYDSPNFIFHHTYIGSTPVVDVHVYAGRQESPCGSEWVPDWSKDVTSLFVITAHDGKNATVEGIMPDTGEVFVTVHIDYQISASLTWDQVQSFKDFKYTFGAMVYFSIIGGHTKLPVGNVK